MKRYLQTFIEKDIRKKVIILTGPRQAGKTTLARMLNPETRSPESKKIFFDYINFDSSEHRLILQEKSWDRKKDFIIFDELHKLKNWKSWLKGIYDTEGIPPGIIVTGSAKLDTYRKMGDSLAGRFFLFRLYPLDLKEILQFHSKNNLSEIFNLLLTVGGFPEPFLEGTVEFYNRWKQSHLDIILRQDLLDLENVRNISLIETLIQLLRKRVGSILSYSSLARDLQISDKTVKRWINILEDMYVIFRIYPYHRNISRSIIKAPKIYFYDTGQVLGDTGVRLENQVAISLLKEIHSQKDCFGKHRELFYLRDKGSKEVDFFITQDEKPMIMIEVKWKDNTLSPNFSIFEKYFKNNIESAHLPKIQLVKELIKEKTFPFNAEIRKAENWLANLSLS